MLDLLNFVPRPFRRMERYPSVPPYSFFYGLLTGVTLSGSTLYIMYLIWGLLVIFVSPLVIVVLSAVNNSSIYHFINIIWDEGTGETLSKHVYYTKVTKCAT